MVVLLCFLVFIILAFIYIWTIISPYINSFRDAQTFWKSFKQEYEINKANNSNDINSSSKRNNHEDSTSNLPTTSSTLSSTSLVQLASAPPPSSPKRLAIKFFVSLVIDVIGGIAASIPYFGSLFEVIWAPVSSFLIYNLYQSKLFAGLGLIEELIPIVGLFPTALLAWLKEFLSYLLYIVAKVLVKIKET